MISFYPGPSKVYPQVPKWVKKAHSRGFLSINHRSEEFQGLMKTTQSLLRQKLGIPSSYQCFFTSSATECWEIIAQSVIETRSAHIFNGAFGKKWFQYTHHLKPQAQDFPFGPNEEISPQVLQGDKDFDLIALTQNETSNGTQVKAASLQGIAQEYSDSLIALDATSSLGGIELPWETADIWYASVQKCLGLPAGMGLLICSPRCMEKAESAADRSHYNSLLNLQDHMQQHQTAYTPNVLNIYLLHEMLSNRPGISKVHKRLQKRYQLWMQFIDGLQTLKPLINNPQVRSHTVIPLTGSQDQITEVITQSKRSGFQLGLGYGDLKATTLRIANFPAIRKKEIKALQKLWTSKGY